MGQARSTKLVQSALSTVLDWITPIDLLFLDGDQSRKGVREAYNSWEPFLKGGGIIAVHNSAPENHISRARRPSQYRRRGNQVATLQ